MLQWWSMAKGAVVHEEALREGEAHREWLGGTNRENRKKSKDGLPGSYEQRRVEFMHKAAGFEKDRDSRFRTSCFKDP